MLRGEQCSEKASSSVTSRIRDTKRNAAVLLGEAPT